MLSHTPLTTPRDASQEASIEHLNKVVKILWHEVERLQQCINVGHHEVIVKVGDALIQLKSDGSIAIKGKNIEVNGSGKVSVKASGDVVIKGSKILQN
jgi:hypothetical protein